MLHVIVNKDKFEINPRHLLWIAWSRIFTDESNYYVGTIFLRMDHANIGYMKQLRPENNSAMLWLIKIEVARRCVSCINTAVCVCIHTWSYLFFFLRMIPNLILSCCLGVPSILFLCNCIMHGTQLVIHPAGGLRPYVDRYGALMLVLLFWWTERMLATRLWSGAKTIIAWWVEQKSRVYAVGGAGTLCV
jgi:hypothetical protein